MKVIVKTIAGSHLFGTNTEKSDHDYKGIYLPSIEDCITGEVVHSIVTKTNNTNSRNTSSDVDCELYSIQKFGKLLEQGQTIAYELLFTPDELILEKDEYLWKIIQDNKDKLVHRNIKAFIGYARSQCDRYSLLGSKANELERMIKLLDSFNKYEKIIQNKDALLYAMPTTYCKFEKVVVKGVEYEYLVVNGKKFAVSSTIGDVKERLIDMDQMYGNRTRLAQQNNNYDYKAISHAVRVCYQGLELLGSGSIQFPLKQKELLLDIKLGKKFVEETNDLLIDLFEQLNKAYNNSKLSDNINTKPLILEMYGNVYKL